MTRDEEIQEFRKMIGNEPLDELDEICLTILENCTRNSDVSFFDEEIFTDD